MPVLAHVLRWPSCRLGEAVVGESRSSASAHDDDGGTESGLLELRRRSQAGCTQLG